MDSSSQPAAVLTRSTRRFWQRQHPPSPWWPWGILLPIGMLLLWLYGATRTANHMEDEIEYEVSKNLSSNGYSSSQYEMSGQEVALSADAQGPNGVSRARAVARATQCDTWMGRLICPTAVAISASAVAVAAAPAAAAPMVVSRAHDFDFQAENGTLTLTGEVPNEEQHQQLLAAANSRFADVRDEMTISGDTAKQEWPSAATRAMQVLPQLQQGRAQWRAGAFKVSGVVLSEKEADARQTFNSEPNAPSLRTIDLALAEPANTCDEAFASALATNTINFATSSAQIDNSSNVLLDELAELANSCPGRLMIEGHTDNTGQAAYNQQLSQSRADAVQQALTDLGVDLGRMSARGFGSDQPIADNSTPDGRAKNRRIVIQTDAALTNDR